jgi:hypothetical protein
MMIGKFLHDPNSSANVIVFKKEKIYSYHGRYSLNFIQMAQWIYDCDTKQVIKSRTLDNTTPTEEELCWMMLQAIPYK